MDDDLARELEEFWKVLALPTVGRPCRAIELAELRRLIENYPDEAHEMLRDLRGRS